MHAGREETPCVPLDTDFEMDTPLTHLHLHPRRPCYSHNSRTWSAPSSGQTAAAGLFRMSDRQGLVPPPLSLREPAQHPTPPGPFSSASPSLPSCRPKISTALPRASSDPDPEPCCSDTKYCLARPRRGDCSQASFQPIFSPDSGRSEFFISE